MAEDRRRLDKGAIRPVDAGRALPMLGLQGSFVNKSPDRCDSRSLVAVGAGMLRSMCG